MYISKTKLANAFKRVGVADDVEFINCRNVTINGRKRGFSGFIKCISNGRYIYVTSDCMQIERVNFMARYCLDPNTYSGKTHGNNEWYNDNDPDALARALYKLLKNDFVYEHYITIVNRG